MVLYVVFNEFKDPVGYIEHDWGSAEGAFYFKHQSQEIAKLMYEHKKQWNGFKDTSDRVIEWSKSHPITFGLLKLDKYLKSESLYKNKANEIKMYKNYCPRSMSYPDYCMLNSEMKRIKKIPNKRSFRLLLDNKVAGRYTGKTPLMAAKRAFKNAEYHGDFFKDHEDGFKKFTIKEITLNGKRKQHTYIGKKIELEEPIIIKRKDHNIEIKYRYHIKALKE